MKGHNSLGSGALIPTHMAKWPTQLGALPVARSWIDVKTSFWRPIRMNRLTGGAVLAGFTDIMCECNTYGSEGNATCARLPHYRMPRSQACPLLSGCEARKRTFQEICSSFPHRCRPTRP